MTDRQGFNFAGSGCFVQTPAVPQTGAFPPSPLPEGFSIDGGTAEPDIYVTMTISGGDATGSSSDPITD